MRPDKHTVQQLFERDVRYIVPLYQRPYVWDEDHQWRPYGMTSLHYCSTRRAVINLACGRIFWGRL